jgi:hypothetical protein
MSREVDYERIVKQDETATERIAKALGKPSGSAITVDDLAELKKRVGPEEADRLHDAWRRESLNY